MSAELTTDEFKVFMRAAFDRIGKLERIAEALGSVLSEEGVKEYLSAYVIGVELIERARELEVPDASR